MLISAARRTAVLALASAAALAVWAGAAFASFTVPGSIPSTDGITRLPVTGTLAVMPGGTPTDIVQTELGSAWYTGVNNVFQLHWWLFFTGADGRIAGAELVAPGCGTYVFNDTAGTLTVHVVLAPSLVVDTQDPDTGWLGGPNQQVTVTSGAGTWDIVYRADTAAQKKSLISAHKSADTAAARNRQLDRANALTNLILALQG